MSTQQLDIQVRSSQESPDLQSRFWRLNIQMVFQIMGSNPSMKRESEGVSPDVLQMLERDKGASRSRRNIQ